MTPNEIRLAISAMPARVALSLTVLGEAAGEGPAGWAGVAWTVKNRAAAWRKTIQAVCFQANQFSCWWGDDANSRRLMKRAEAVLMGGSPGIADAAWLDLANTCHRVLLGTLPDPTGGALYYVTADELANPEHAGYWYQRKVADGTLIETARIGRHVFHKESGR